MSRGTDGSNPLPSSGESRANLSFGVWFGRWSRITRRGRPADPAAGRARAGRDRPSWIRAASSRRLEYP